MGATYTRQSSSGIVDGGVIEATDLNAEFDQLLAAFAVSTGHSHDGTAAEGGPITKLLGTSITIGDGTSGTDIAVTFDGETADGVLTWMEDEDYFKFSDDILVNSTEKLMFQDTGTYIYSNADGDLDVVSDGTAVDSINLESAGGITLDAGTAGSGIVYEDDGTEMARLYNSSSDVILETKVLDKDFSIKGNDGGSAITALSLDMSAAGAATFNDKVVATELDISGDMDIDGTSNLDAVDIDGAVQIDNTVTVGVDDTGYDVKFFGDTASAYMLWDTSADDLVFAGSAGIDLAGDIDVDGTANLDNTDIDGTLAVDGTTISLDATTSLNIDNSNTSNGITIGTATSGVPISIGHSTSEVTVNDNLTVTGTLTLGSGAELTEAELEMLDGITAGTVAANKAVVVDSNKDAASFRNITLTGELDAATLDISGDADIDGTLEADAITVDGTALATYIRDTVGTNMLSSNTESGITVTYDTSNDNIDFAIDAAQTTITSLLATDIKIGEDDQTKIDFETADEIHFYANNTEQVYVADNIFGPQSDSDVDLGSTSVRWKDAFVDSITVTGEVDGASLDISGNADIDGTLEADAITVDGTALATYIRDTVGTNMVSSNTESGITVTYDTTNDNIDFAIDAAQTTITSILATDVKIGEDDQTKIDFETADTINFYAGNEKQLILTDGALTPGSNAIVDLGTDALEFKDAYFDGTLEADAITIGGTNISAIYSAIAGSSSIVTTGALDSGSITSGFGTIDTGSSTITTTGLITGGSLDIDNVLINGTTIGHTDDTDLMTVADGLLTVAGEISVTTLDIGGTNVSATAAELNYSDLATLGTTAASKVFSADANNLTKITGGVYLEEDTLSFDATQDWDVRASPVAKVTLTANVTFDAPSNPTTGQYIAIVCIQDGTGSRTIAWNAVFEFTGDTAPTATTTASKGDMFTFRYNGSKWLEVGRNLNLTLS